jgi:hypothetical protein
MRRLRTPVAVRAARRSPLAVAAEQGDAPKLQVRELACGPWSTHTTLTRMGGAKHTPGDPVKKPSHARAGTRAGRRAELSKDASRSDVEP